MKALKILIAAFLTLMFASCETTIPEVDTTPPGFNFRITGDGFERNFTHDEEDFSTIQLYLKANTSYDFIYSPGDPGGLQLAQWQISQFEDIRFTSDISSPWTIRDLSIFNRMITWTGNRSNPVTGAILNGSFTTGQVIGSNQKFVEFIFTVRDYGGRNGPSNSAGQLLNISIGNHGTKVVQL